MSRAAVILSAGLALAVPVLAGAGDGSVSGAPGTTVPSAIVAAVTPTSTTVAGEVTTTVPATTVPRGGATSGSIAKPEPAEGWTAQRLAILTALGIVALAAAGYAFGRIRSAPPIHPDL